jgi:hypothetical protein
LGKVGLYEFFVGPQFAGPPAEGSRGPDAFVSPFWVVAKSDSEPNMELRKETVTFGTGVNKVQVGVPQMHNTCALSAGDFLVVKPWPRLQPRPAKKLRTA